MALIYTVGHSTHPIETFMSLLKRSGITAIGDVRSSPRSRINPQYNQGSLKESLREAGIVYVFLGRELGARPDDPGCYEAGCVHYDRIAGTPFFARGLDRVAEGTKHYRLALMCAEKEPLDCHRTILVARHLVERGHQVQHILADGILEDHSATMARLMQRQGLDTGDMFRSEVELVAKAYSLREGDIAYASSPETTLARSGETR